MSRIKRELDDSDQERAVSKQRVINRLAKEVVRLTAKIALLELEIVRLKQPRHS